MFENRNLLRSPTTKQDVSTLRLSFLTLFPLLVKSSSHKRSCLIHMMRIGELIVHISAFIETALPRVVDTLFSKLRWRWVLKSPMWNSTKNILDINKLKCITYLLQTNICPWRRQVFAGRKHLGEWIHLIIQYLQRVYKVIQSELSWTS